MSKVLARLSLIRQRTVLVLLSVPSLLSALALSAGAAPLHHSGNLYVHQDHGAPFATLRIEVPFSRPIVMSPEDIAVAVTMTVAADHHPRLGYSDYQNRLAVLQASLRLALSDDHMAIVLRAPRSEFVEALMLLRQALWSARPGVEGAELAESQVQTLVARRRSDPRRRSAFELLENAISCKDLDASPRDNTHSDLTKASDTNHVIGTRPLRLALVGDFDAETLDAVVSSKLYRAAGPFTDAGDCRFVSGVELVRVEGQNPQSILSFVIDLGKRGSVPYETVNAMRSLLESRLHQALRQENGLTYRVRTGVLRRGALLLLTGQLGLDPADVDDAIRLTRNDVEDLWARGPSATEIETAWSRTRLDGFTSLFSSESTASRILMLSNWNEVKSEPVRLDDEMPLSRLPQFLANAPPPRMRFLVIGQN